MADDNFVHLCNLKKDNYVFILDVRGKVIVARIHADPQPGQPVRVAKLERRRDGFWNYADNIVTIPIPARTVLATFQFDDDPPFALEQEEPFRAALEACAEVPNIPGIKQVITGPLPPQPQPPQPQPPQPQPPQLQPAQPQPPQLQPAQPLPPQPQPVQPQPLQADNSQYPGGNPQPVARPQAVRFRATVTDPSGARSQYAGLRIGASAILDPNGVTVPWPPPGIISSYSEEEETMSSDYAPEFVIFDMTKLHTFSPSAPLGQTMIRNEVPSALRQAGFQYIPADVIAQINNFALWASTTNPTGLLPEEIRVGRALMDEIRIATARVNGFSEAKIRRELAAKEHKQDTLAQVLSKNKPMRKVPFFRQGGPAKSDPPQQHPSSTSFQKTCNRCHQVVEGSYQDHNKTCKSRRA